MSEFGPGEAAAKFSVPEAATASGLAVPATALEAPVKPVAVAKDAITPTPPPPDTAPAASPIESVASTSSPTPEPTDVPTATVAESPSTSEEPDETEKAAIAAGHDTESAPASDRETAVQLAERLIEGRISVINRKTGSIPKAEQNLRDIDTFRNGFAPKRYASGEGGRIKLEEGLPTQDKDGNDVVVQALLSDTMTDGQREYTCMVEGSDKPVKVTADAVVKAHMEKRADSIARNFSGPNEAALVSWYAKGGEGEAPSADTLKLVEDDLNDPFKNVDMALADQITLLDASLSAEGMPDAERQTKTKLLTELKLAEVVQGDVGKLLKLNMLKRAQEHAGQVVSQQIEGVLQGAEPQREKLQQSLEDTIVASGQSKEKIEAWKKLAADPEGLGKLLSDPDFINLPDMSDAVFGKDLSAEQAALIDERIEDFAKTHLTEAQKTAWDIAKKTGKGAGIVLAILLAIPAVAVGLAGAATVEAVGMGAGVKK